MRLPQSLAIDHLTLLTPDALLSRFPHAKTLAIVGNGVVEPESTAEIAAADIVVRFNNWNSRRECQLTSLPHSGQRGDVVITHMDCLPVRTPPWSAPGLLVLAIPAPFQIDRNPLLLEVHYRDTALAMVNPYLNRLLCLELGYASDGYKHPLPTVGLTFLYHFWRFNMQLTAYVCGMDWHYDAAKDTYDRAGIAHALPPGNHSYLREARWVQRTLLDHPSWRFSARADAALRRLAGFATLPCDTSDAASWPRPGPWKNHDRPSP